MLSIRKTSFCLFFFVYSGASDSLLTFILSFSLVQIMQKRLMELNNRGLDATSRKAKKRALELATEQLENRYWLLFFEDDSCQAIWSRHGCINMDMVLRTKGLE